MPEMSFRGIESSISASMDTAARSLKTLGATALAVVSLMTNVAEAGAQPIGSSAPKISLKLPHVPELQETPGFGLTVTGEQQQELQNSAVSISIMSPVAGLGGTCSGNAIEYQDNKYVTTAAHCFGEATWVDNGLLDPLQGSTTALDFLKLERPYEVTITDESYPVYRTVHGQRRAYYSSPPPMAGIKGLAIGLRRGDDALLLPDITQAVPSNKSRTFDQVLPLSYNPAIEPPSQGESVALYSMPGFHAVGVAATGLYAGRIIMPGEKRLADVVVEHSRNEAHDPCSEGGSGATGLAADDRQLIGASEGLNFGYGRNNDLFSSDRYSRNSARRMWRHYERLLNVNIPPLYDTFCFFDVSDQQSMPNLVGAFGIYATKHERNPL